MEHGFEHLRGLEDLWKMSLVNNRYLTDDSIEMLSKYTKVRILDSGVIILHGIIMFQDKLKWLHLASNGNITDEGLLNLTRMKKLEYLKLGNLGNLKRPEETVNSLEAELGDCLIEFPPYRSHEKIEE